MKQGEWLNGNMPLKALSCEVFAACGGFAQAAEKPAAPESTMVVTAAAPSSSGQEDETSIVAHEAEAGTKSSSLISRTPQSISVVTQAQIAAMAAKNVPETLRYVAGVSSESAGPDTRFDTITVRGFEADEYLDGLRLPREAWWSRPAWDPFLLSRIEVVKGPASVLYGQANPGGVVNLVSKTPQAQPGGQVYVSAGNNNQFGTGFDVTGPLTDSKAWLGRVAGTFFDTKTQVDHTRYQHYDIAPSLTWQPNDRTTLTLLAELRKDPDSGFYNMMPVNGTLVNNPNGKIGSNFYGGQPGFDTYSRQQGSIGYQFRTELNDNVTLRQNVRYISSSADYRMVYPFGTYATRPLVDRYSMNLTETMSNFAADNQGEFRFDTGPVSHTAPVGMLTALTGGPLLILLASKARHQMPEAAPSVYEGEPAGVRFPAGMAFGLLAVAVVLSLFLGQGLHGWHWTTLMEQHAILPMRLPRLLAALSAGALLAAAGVLMQRVSGNPLASPEIPGIGGGAAMGVTAFLLLFPGAAPG